MNRREFIKVGAAGVAGAGLAAGPRALARPNDGPITPRTPRADACILIWLPGGIAQTDTWDPKEFTPFRAGMKGSELRGTCRPIPTAADGVMLGEGLEGIASVMDKGCILRSLANDVMFGAIHLKAQYYMMTGYLFPAGVKAPSIGSIVSRSLGRRDPNVPPYIYIGRDIDTSDEERLFISEYIGPGFYGVNHAPFMIPDAAKGMATLETAAGVTRDRLDRRQGLLQGLAALSDPGLRGSPRAQEYLRSIDEARAMMDSPVKRAFAYREEESAELIAEYEPRITERELRDTSYYYGGRFGHGLLLARRLVEAGARFIQVEYQYGPFKGFDMHEYGSTRMAEMKRQIDRPIARLIRDLDERGMLDRTLVVIATEFGRTIASQPAAGVEPDGASETHNGENLVVEHEGMYGFHGHFSSVNCMLFFGGGFRRGHAHGRTSDRHPMVAIEDPVRLIDAHATMYAALGIPPDHSYLTERRPFYVTKDGKGVPVAGLMA